MRKITAIIVSTAFMAMQYAQQVSYLECKLSNYFRTPAQQCDCEKILSEDKSETVPFPVPPPHNHVHIDETYCIPRQDIPLFHCDQHALIFNNDPHGVLCDGVPGQPEHPPQIG